MNLNEIFEKNFKDMSLINKIKRNIQNQTINLNSLDIYDADKGQIDENDIKSEHLFHFLSRERTIVQHALNLLLNKRYFENSQMVLNPYFSNDKDSVSQEVNEDIVIRGIIKIIVLHGILLERETKHSRISKCPYCDTELLGDDINCFICMAQVNDDAGERTVDNEEECDISVTRKDSVADNGIVCNYCQCELSSDDSKCPICDSVNEPSRSIGNDIKATIGSNSSHHDQPHQREWTCELCGQMNSGGTYCCCMCEQTALFVDKWFCEVCDTVNVISSPVCSECNERKSVRNRVAIGAKKEVRSVKLPAPLRTRSSCNECGYGLQKRWSTICDSCDTITIGIRLDNKISLSDTLKERLIEAIENVLANEAAEASVRNNITDEVNGKITNKNGTYKIESEQHKHSVCENRYSTDDGRLNSFHDDSDTLTDFKNDRNNCDENMSVRDFNGWREAAIDEGNIDGMGKKESHHLLQKTITKPKLL